MTRSAAQIRQEFIDYFVQRCGHVFVPSSPVVPHDDPTLLFTNAGMNQFKPIFLGVAEQDSAFGRLRRAVNSQKCIRAGGKHNDLDDVGHDTYHHTFFEMLGNWSFGDYFKEDAIRWAWDLLVNVWGLDPRRLHATYFGGLRRPTEHTRGRAHAAPDGCAEASGAPWELEPDYESRDLWQRLAGLPPERVHPGNMKDNFWEMGDTGPCGPCSEIHIDLSERGDCGHLVNAGDPRVIEIWNLVFIQFNRNPDRSLTPLPAKHVDTGMGFERITAVVQGKKSNYDTDIFAPIFAAIQQVTGAAAYGGRLESSQVGGTPDNHPRDAGAALPDAAVARQGAGVAQGEERAALLRDVAYRVIADHIRTLTLALTDGAVPDKEGRGYVLRRILRRAVRYGWQYLNMHEPFLHKLVPAVVAALGDAFPELDQQSRRVAGLIREEEESFGRTLARGLTLFDEAAARARAAAAAAPRGAYETGEAARLGGTPAISGEDAFRLHDTYGFPIDLTEIMAREQGLNVDLADYERRMEAARVRARGSSAAEQDEFAAEKARIELRSPCDDSPKYAADLSCPATILTLTASGTPAAGQPLVFTTDRTCLYVEQGGQVGDTGVFECETGQIEVRRVEYVVHEGRRHILHCGYLRSGTISAGQSGTLRVFAARRAIMRNHTATHLLNLALRETLDSETRSTLQQKGSLVDAEKTRFDFSHPKALTTDEQARIEAFVNEQIRRDLPVYTNENVPVAQAAARKINTLRAVFGEKYPDEVRVVSIGAPIAALLNNPDSPEWFGYSVEFCGGTHVAATGEIGDFVLTHEEAVAKGVRRLIGISGDAARTARAAGERLIKLFHEAAASPAALHAPALAALQQELAATTLPLAARHAAQELLARVQEAARRQEKASASESSGQVAAYVTAELPRAAKVGATTLLVVETPDFPVEQLKHGADVAKAKAGSAAVVFGCRTGEKCTLLVAFSDDLVQRGLKAGDLVKAIAPLVGGGGGGPPTMAQAGGKDPSRLPEALAAAAEWLRARLG